MNRQYLDEVVKENREIFIEKGLDVENGKEFFELNDGNHRHEALVRLGAISCQVIIWITEAHELELFTKRYTHCLENY